MHCGEAKVLGGLFCSKANDPASNSKDATQPSLVGSGPVMNGIGCSTRVPWGDDLIASGSSRKRL